MAKQSKASQNKFLSLIENGRFVDQSMAIDDFITDSQKLYYIARPSKHAKTTIMDMLKVFFDEKTTDHDFKKFSSLAINEKLKKGEQMISSNMRKFKIAQISFSNVMASRKYAICQQMYDAFKTEVSGLRERVKEKKKDEKENESDESDENDEGDGSHRSRNDKTYDALIFEYFKEAISKLVNELSKSDKFMIFFEDFKKWYSIGSEDLLNPSSVMQCISKQKIGVYFRGGLYTNIIKGIENKHKAFMEKIDGNRNPDYLDLDKFLFSKNCLITQFSPSKIANLHTSLVGSFKDENEEHQSLLFSILHAEGLLACKNAESDYPSFTFLNEESKSFLTDKLKFIPYADAEREVGDELKAILSAICAKPKNPFKLTRLNSIQADYFSTPAFDDALYGLMQSYPPFVDSTKEFSKMRGLYANEEIFKFILTSMILKGGFDNCGSEIRKEIKKTNYYCDIAVVMNNILCIIETKFITDGETKPETTWQPEKYIGIFKNTIFLYDKVVMLFIELFRSKEVRSGAKVLSKTDMTKILKKLESKEKKEQLEKEPLLTSTSSVENQTATSISGLTEHGRTSSSPTKSLTGAE